MAINPKTQEDQEDLNKRLRSLKIDRGPTPSSSPNTRSPKILLLALSALVALVAVGSYFYFSSAAKPISGVEGKMEGGGTGHGGTVFSASRYVVAPQQIALGAKVKGRLDSLGV